MNAVSSPGIPMISRCTDSRKSTHSLALRQPPTNPVFTELPWWNHQRDPSIKGKEDIPFQILVGKISGEDGSPLGHMFPKRMWARRAAGVKRKT